MMNAKRELLSDLDWIHGARRPARVRKATLVMSAMVLGYSAIMWSIILLVPGVLIRIFSSDETLIRDAVPALKQYFAVFIFMDCQYIGQTVFLGIPEQKETGDLFSLLLRQPIAVPLTYFMPYIPIWEPPVPFSSPSRYPRHWWQSCLCDDAVYDPAGIVKRLNQLSDRQSFYLTSSRLFWKKSSISSQISF